MIPQEILMMAHRAMNDSSVYRSFAMVNGAKAPKRASTQWFGSLPISSKETYINKANFSQLFDDPPEVAYASSGSSGTPTFWFGDKRVTASGERLHSHIFDKIFRIKKSDPTLVVVTFAMGLWVAGLFTADAARAMKRTGYRITTITPGIDQNECLETLRRLRKHYKHIVIAGYPPFVLDLVRKIAQEKLSHPSYRVLAAGAQFSEEWRDEVMRLVNITHLEHVIGLYGSADAGSMAFETQETIALRRTTLSNEKLRTILYGSSDRVGGLYQYLPQEIYFENHEKEILVTKYMPIPLIRYNIHDIGLVHERAKLSEQLIDRSLRAKVSKLSLPILSIIGRTDVAVTLYALNIYPEHIAAGLSNIHCTGSYRAYAMHREGAHSEQLVVDIELKDGISVSSKLTEKITASLIRALLAHNIEFKKLYTQLHEAAKPRVVLYKKGENLAKKRVDRALTQIVGKKPKIQISN